MDASHLLLWHREHAEGIVVAQVLLGREGKPGEVFEPLEVCRLDARRVEFPPVGGHVLVGVPERPFEPIDLQRGDLVARCLLDRLQAVRLIGLVDHASLHLRPHAPRSLTPGSHSPSIVREWPRNSAITKPSSRVTVTS